MASAVPIGPSSIAAMPADRFLKLAATATVAGIFSGLFGVGGGTVIVPMLIFLFAYGERAATGTSMVAIAVIGLFAALGQALYGNVELAEGLLVGIPAVGGVIVGAAVQQRVPERVISLLFAALLTVVAIQFLIG
jgi:uncharacterized protein